MKIVSNINGNTKTTTYGNKLYYRASASANYTQIKRAFFRNSASGNYTQIYLFDSTAPAITFTSSTATTVVAAYTLTATVSDSESKLASITVNGVNYPITSGSSSVNVSKAFTLSNGTNTFTIRATDLAGNVGEKSISVILKNDSSNPSANWGNTWIEDTRNYKKYYVVVNGTNYVYYQYGYAEADSFADSYTNLDSTIPLPHGLHSLTFNLNSSGDCGQRRSASGRVSVTIYDATTNTNIASKSISWSANDDGHGHTSYSGDSTATWTCSFNTTQSTHDLYVIISGAGHGSQHSWSQCHTGIESFSFNYY